MPLAPTISYSRGIRRKLFLLWLMVAVPGAAVVLASYWVARAVLYHEVESGIKALADDNFTRLDRWNRSKPSTGPATADRMADDAALLLSSAFGHPGERVYLIDSLGRITASALPSTANRHTVTSARASSAIVTAALADSRRVVRFENEFGVDALGTGRWYAPLGLGIVVERDYAEALGILGGWGTTIWVLLLAVTIVAVAFGSVLVNRILKTLEHREREILTTHQQLITADRLASVGMMAASVAHEVNNPLTTIKVLMHTLQEGLPPGDSRRSDLDIVQTEIDKIKTLILRLLQFARPREPEFAAVGVNHILSRVVGLIRPLAQTRDLIVDERYAPMDPVWADGSQLGQVFINIFFNAVEAAPHGGHIRVETRIENGSVVATIWNSGQGIAPELQEQVFDPFFTTKANGTGLGLSIARMIVDKHKGTIRAVGHGADGTSFHITLPTGRRE